MKWNTFRTFNTFVRLYRAVMGNRPAWSTGIYITDRGVSYGRRTNRAKAPDNYFFFEEDIP